MKPSLIPHSVLAAPHPHPRSQQPTSEIERSFPDFHEIDQTALDFDNTARNHITHLSDASSIHSTAHRYSFFPEPPLGIPNDPPQAAMNLLSRHHNETLPIVPSPITKKHSGTSRASDASSHQPPYLSSPSNNNSHRNTRELGDFYDSYWRHSGQSTVGSGNATGANEGARAEKKHKEGRRHGRLGIEVPFITEVETSIRSPAPTGSRGIEVGLAI